MPLPLSKAERETVIRCVAVDGEWDVCTADERFIGYLKRMGYTAATDRQFGEPYLAFRVPFRDLRVRRFGRAKRIGNLALKPPTKSKDTATKTENT